MSYDLMLAQRSERDPEWEIRRLQRTGEWTFEFKYDGIRALVFVNHGDVKVINRNGRDITYRYPDVVDRLKALRLHAVIDGEIVCLDEKGRPDFSRVHKRDAQGSARNAAVLSVTLPATLVAFDLLEDAGADMRWMPYHKRRDYLTDKTEVLAGAGVVVPPVDVDGETLWKVVEELGLEGLMAKRTNSSYTGRRSGAWLKIKRTHRISALVSGWDPGEGSRSGTFGCLHLSLLDEQLNLVGIGAVGTGFTDADSEIIWARLVAGAPPIIVDVQFLEASPTGQLRHPSFKGVRNDLEVTDCSTEQLHIGR